MVPVFINGTEGAPVHRHSGVVPDHLVIAERQSEVQFSIFTVVEIFVNVAKAIIQIGVMPLSLFRVNII